MRPLDKSNDVAKAQPEVIHTFIDLVKNIAQCSFENKDYLLFFRGQREDYKNRLGNSTFYPSIYRTERENLSKELVQIRFKKLDQASKLLVEKFEVMGILDPSLKEIKNRKYIRWSIIRWLFEEI